MSTELKQVWGKLEDAFIKDSIPQREIAFFRDAWHAGIYDCLVMIETMSKEDDKQSYEKLCEDIKVFVETSLTRIVHEQPTHTH